MDYHSHLAPALRTLIPYTGRDPHAHPSRVTHYLPLGTARRQPPWPRELLFRRRTHTSGKQ
jgi:hypothetical protein